MPVQQISNPLGAYGLPPGVGAWDGNVTVEAQNRSTQDIAPGMAVKLTLATSSFYGPGVATVVPTTGPIGTVPFGIALETIQAIQAVTPTTGATVAQQPNFQQGSVAIYGVVYAAFPPGGNGPGATAALPSFVTIPTSSCTGIVGASSIAGVCTATTTSLGGLATSVATTSSPLIVGIAYTSVGLTAAGSTTLFPIFVGKGA